MIQKIYITQKDAVERYGYSKYWWERCRWDGTGPKFLKIKGKILYPLKETDEFFAKHVLRSNTSEVGGISHDNA